MSIGAWIAVGIVVAIAAFVTYKMRKNAKPDQTIPGGGGGGPSQS